MKFSFKNISDWEIASDLYNSLTESVKLFIDNPDKIFVVLKESYTKVSFIKSKYDFYSSPFNIHFKIDEFLPMNTKDDMEYTVKNINFNRNEISKTIEINSLILSRNINYPKTEAFTYYLPKNIKNNVLEFSHSSNPKSYGHNITDSDKLNKYLCVMENWIKDLSFRDKKALIRKLNEFKNEETIYKAIKLWNFLTLKFNMIFSLKSDNKNIQKENVIKILTPDKWAMIKKDVDKAQEKIKSKLFSLSYIFNI
jgi:hypothetical protein